MTTFHKVATIMWLVVGGALTYRFPDSVPWIAFMSLYANVIGHWGSYQSARAEEKVDATQ